MKPHQTLNQILNPGVSTSKVNPSARHAKPPIVRKAPQFVTDADGTEQERPKKERDQSAAKRGDTFEIPAKLPDLAHQRDLPWARLIHSRKRLRQKAEQSFKVSENSSRSANQDAQGFGNTSVCSADCFLASGAGGNAVKSLDRRFIARTALTGRPGAEARESGRTKC